MTGGLHSTSISESAFVNKTKEWFRVGIIIMTFSISLWPAGSPVPPGAKPKNLGDIAAGEGPAWDGKGNLYFTGRSGLLGKNGVSGVPLANAADNERFGFFIGDGDQIRSSLELDLLLAGHIML